MLAVSADRNSILCVNEWYIHLNVVQHPRDNGIGLSKAFPSLFYPGFGYGEILFCAGNNCTTCVKILEVEVGETRIIWRGNILNSGINF